MKLKNSNESLGLKILFPVMYGASLLLVVLRCLQLTKYIDSETGFYIGGGAVNFLFYAVTVAVCLFFVAVSFLSSEGARLETAALKDKGASIAATAFGVSLVYDSLSSLIDSFMLLDEMSVGAFNQGAELFKSMMATGVLPYALESIFALLSAVYIFILAKSFSKGSLAAHKNKFMALAPVAWVAFKLITRFVKQISYIKVSDLFLELIMLAFMILFFVALSQVTSGVYSDDSRWRITGLGLSGALLSFAVNVPRFILGIFANDFVNKEYPFNLADCAFAVFAVFVALATVKNAQNNEIKD